MEPTTSLVTALAAKSGDAALEAAKKEATGFLNQLLGPSAAAIGESFALRHRERMFNNIVEVLQRAKKKLKNSGLTPEEVPLKIIHPLLEAASLEEAKKKVFNGVWDLIDGSKGNGVVEENFELAEVLTDEDHFVCEVEAD